MLVRIEQFPGVNKKETETLLKPGEASDSLNVLITDDLKPKKMYGYSRLFTALTKPINGMWYGSLSGTNHFIFSCNGHIYEQNLSTHENTDLGTVEDAYTSFFVSNNTVYILDGDDIYSWAGSGSIASITGYIPTVVTASPPEGGGTLLEPINYLTGTKIQKFSPDGLAATFQLIEYDIDSVDLVTLNGVNLTVTTDYTVDLVAGTITIVAGAPAEGTNSLEVKFTKTVAGDRDLIVTNKYYGGVYYSRFWLFGNPSHLNTRYVSGVTMDGVSDPTYWPKFADSDVGEYEITGICTQYDKQIIYTSGDAEASSWYSYVDSYTDETTGLEITQFPVKPINSQYGNEAKGQIKIIYNDPFTLWKGVYQWDSSAIVNEKDVKWVSEKIQKDLDALDLSTALTVDWPHKGLYWLCVGKKVWVLNYRVGAWYILELAHTPTCFIVADGEMYFGTSTGTIMKFSSTLGTHDGADINSYYDTGYMTFDKEFVEKEIWDMLIAIYAYTETHLDIFVSTDKNANWVQIEPDNPVRYSLSNFSTWDFSTFSFATNYSPQPFKRSPRLSGIGYAKFRFQSNGSDTFALLSTIYDVVYNDVTNRR
jgi:hypothetical protein